MEQRRHTVRVVMCIIRLCFIVAFDGMFTSHFERIFWGNIDHRVIASRGSHAPLIQDVAGVLCMLCKKVYLESVGCLVTLGFCCVICKLLKVNVFRNML